MDGVYNTEILDFKINGSQEHNTSLGNLYCVDSVWSG